MLAVEAALRSLRDISHLFFYLVTRPFKLEAKIGIFKTLVAFVVASFLLINLLVWPLLDEYIFKHDRNTIYLNILEPPGYARNASYLCEFKTHVKDNAILSYNQSYDGRMISIATGEGDFSKSNCRQYFPGYLFNDYSVQGTIINVFYSGSMHTELNSTRGYNEIITIYSNSPMKLFIRNKNAVLVQQNENMGTLMKGIARLSHSVKEGFSFSGGYLNYSRHFVFKHPERYHVHKTFHHPQVFAYDLPNLNKWEVTNYASYSYEPKLSVNLQIPQKKSGESFQTFFKIEGQISSRDFYYFGTKTMHIAAYDFIDSEDLSYFSKAWFYGKPLVYGLGIIFLMFFLINAYSMKSGTKLSDVSYNRPHLDDVIRQSQTTAPFGYPEPTRVKQD